MVDGQERIEAVIAETFAEQASDRRMEQTTVYNCPDCGGVLWQEADGPLIRFRCHTGHVFDPGLLLNLKATELENALWTSLRLLKEKATLSSQMALRLRGEGNRELAARVEADALRDRGQVDTLRSFLEMIPNVADQPV